MLQAQIFIDLDEMEGEQSLHDYIIQFLAEHGVQGATSFRAYAGFGRNHKIRHPRDLFSFDEPPAMILFVDEDEKVKSVLAELKRKFPAKMMTMVPVQQA
jgi:uncharacterized protein